MNKVIHVSFLYTIDCMTGKENAEYASLRYEMILMKLRFVVNLPYCIE